MSNKKYEAYKQCLDDPLHSRTLMPDGLWIICASFDDDPDRIDTHMPEMPAKFRNEGIVG